MSETFGAPLLACRRYRPDGAPALALLLGIAQNKLRGSVRRGRVDQRARERLGMALLLLDDDDVVRVEELKGEGALALSLLERLPAPEREAVRARVLADRGYGELAVELGCSEQVVRQDVRRGVKRLRVLMKEQA
jgi:RNA polymerase sigma factor (sigma-70 family)